MFLLQPILFMARISVLITTPFSRHDVRLKDAAKPNGPENVVAHFCKLMHALATAVFVYRIKRILWPVGTALITIEHKVSADLQQAGAVADV